MSAGRSIAVLTTGRQDWGILRSTCAAIHAHSDLELRLVVGGTHPSGRHGRTVDEIRADGFEPHAELPYLADDPDATPEAQAAAVLTGMQPLLHDSDAGSAPHGLLLVGDRFETAAAALAATVARVPIAHLHGGEQTLGAFDDALRHAITKLSHLHLVSHEEHARRVIALGEDPATVHVVGAPGLDEAFRDDLADRDELERTLGVALDGPVVVVTVHPTTLDADPAAAARAVVAAMDAVAATYVITLPNVDPGGNDVRTALEQAAGADRRVAVDALGPRRYWGLLRLADAVLGNSSSGIVEAPAIGLPVVNVGDRQLGRRREGTVIDAPADAGAVTMALRAALSAGRDRGDAPPSRSAGPLADGRAGARIADILARWRPSVPPRKSPIRLPG